MKKTIMMKISLICLVANVASAVGTMSYKQGERMTYVQGEAIYFNQMQNSHEEVVHYTVKPDLPEGLKLNVKNGNISGTPMRKSGRMHYVVHAMALGGEQYELPVSIQVLGATDVNVNAEKVLRDGVKPGFASSVICWLTDGRSRQDIRPAMQQLRPGTLRFPYGHLSDNYLWHDLSQGDPHEGLKPRVATSQHYPANWEFAMKEDGSFQQAMDFDEYMELAQELQIKPMVVVNLLSYKLPGGPSLEYLKKSAVAWVKYAKEKGYDVAYWQLGNEIDHHQKQISLDEFVHAYGEIAGAMKAYDPSIQVGPGLLANISYNAAVLEEHGALVDFLSVHQYLFKFDLSTYEKWRDFDKSLIPNIKRLAYYNDRHGKRPILVTETNAYGGGDLLLGGGRNNVLKGLCWFEMLLSQALVSHVEYSYYWGSSDPWRMDRGGISDASTYALLKRDASLTLRGEVSARVNEALHPTMVETKSPMKELRTFASVDRQSGAVSVFLLNKSEQELQVEVTLDGLPLPAKGDQKVIKATKPSAMEAVYAQHELSQQESGGYQVTVPALSANILQLSHLSK